MQEDPNTLQSKAVYYIIDAISEEPTYGLVSGLQSIYLDDTPIMNESGEMNFKGVSTYSSKDTKAIAASKYASPVNNIRNTVSVGTQVKKNTPVIRTISNPDITEVDVLIRIPALFKQDAATGDMNPHSVTYNIEVKGSDSNYKNVYPSEVITYNAFEEETPDNTIRLNVFFEVNMKPGGWWKLERSFNTGSGWSAWELWDQYIHPGFTPVGSRQVDFESIGFARGGAVDSKSWKVRLVFSPLTANLKKLYYIKATTSGGITVSGKTTSPYDKALRVVLPVGEAPWDIRVTRISDDYETSDEQGDTYWAAYTEIMSQRVLDKSLFSYYLSIDAETFGGAIPARSYDIYGMQIKIPSNYNPWTREYDGNWDGSFKVDWTDNPAWIFYDLLTNKRYGLGDEIDSNQIDKWGLYQIARYCDELVDSPDGGQEARYTCSCVINSQQDAYTLLHAIASAFRGMIYWSGGAITAVADMPSNPVLDVGAANVIDGLFTYQGASRKARHTVARVSWNNPADGDKLNVEIYEDADAIRKYGYRVADVNAFGCKSRGLARRWGKWLVTSDNALPDTISYSASFDHFQLRPGDVIRVSDPNYTAEELFGRIVSITPDASPATSYNIKLDRKVVRIGGHSSEIGFMTPDGVPILIDVSVAVTTDSDTLTIDAVALTGIPLIGSAWLLKKQSVEPRLWRVFSVIESEPNIYDISAALYDESKYDAVESDLNFAEIPYSALPQGEMLPPTNLDFSEFLKQSGSAILECANISWSPSEDVRANFYEVNYRLLESGNVWEKTAPELTSTTSIDILNLKPASYSFRVRAKDATGVFMSPWAYIASATLLGKTKPPANVASVTSTIEKFGVLLSWAGVSDLDLAHYEIREGSSWASSTLVARVNATEYKVEDKAAGTYKFWVKAVDTSGNYSNNAVSTTATISVQSAPTVAAVSVVSGIQLDITGSTTRGFKNYEIQRRKSPDGAASTINSNVLTRIFTDSDIVTLGYADSWQYRARAVDQNGDASAWSDWSVAKKAKQVEAVDITANQIVGKDFRTHCNVGAAVDGVKFDGSGLQAWCSGQKTVDIPISGNPTFSGTICATSGCFSGTVNSCAGCIGGWTIAASCLHATNARLYSGAANTARLEVGTGSYIAGLNSANACGDIAFWAGCCHACRSKAPFNITANGKLTATDATITGTVCATSGCFTGTLAAGIVCTDNIASCAVTSDKISTCAISTDKLAACSVSADKICTNAVTAAKICANAVTAAKICSNAVTADKICSGAVTSDKITSSQIIGKDFRTACDVGASQNGVLLNTNGLQAWKGGQKTVDISNTGDATFTGTICASSGCFTGTLNSCVGCIGNWIIASSCLSSCNARLISGATNTARLEVGTGNYIAGVNSANAAADIAFWAGCCHACRTKAPFKVTANGVLCASGATVSGTICATDGYFGGELAANIVKACNICAGAIETEKIATGAITTEKIDADAITSEKINATSLKMPAGAILDISAKGSTTESIAVSGGVKDVSGNSNHGSAYNGVEVVDSEVGKAFEFDGVDGYVDTNYSMFNGYDASPARTISAWIWWDENQEDAQQSIILGQAYYAGFGIRIHGNVLSSWLRVRGSVTARTITTKRGEWFFVTIVWGGEQDSKLTTYLDGNLLGVNNVSYADFGHDMSIRPFRAGHPYAASDGKRAYFMGKMGNIRVFERALSPEEVKTLYMLGTLEETGTIAGDRVVTGQLKSLNYSSSQGSMLDLDTGVFNFGGDSSPALSWDGTNLNVVGKVTACTGKIGGWDIATNCLHSNNLGLFADGKIQTLDYVSGHKGWRVDCSGAAEFNNICARGELSTVVMKYNEVSVAGGCILAAHAAVACRDCSPTTDNFGVYVSTDSVKGFKLNDVVRLTEGVNDYWGRVCSCCGTTGRVGVTRLSGSRFNFTAGQTITSYGSNTGAGGVLIDGQAPYIDVYTHSGTPYTALESRARIGHLDSWGSFSSGDYGIAIGCPTGNRMTYDTSSSVLNICGSISSTDGNVGGWCITNGCICSTDIRLYSGASARLESGSGNCMAGVGRGTAAADVTFWAGCTYACRSKAPFRLSLDGALTATNATITGTVCACAGCFTGTVNSCAGCIGGWTIAAACLASTNIGLYSGAANTARLQVGTGNCIAGVNSANASGDISFWAGCTHACRAKAPFRVTAGGALYATNADITGAVHATSGCFEGTLGAGVVKAESIDVSALRMPAGAVLDLSAKGSTTESIAKEGGVVDVSGNNNSGQAFGGVQVVDSEVGRAFLSTSTRSRIVLGAPVGGVALTASIWVKRSALAGASYRALFISESIDRGILYLDPSWLPIVFDGTVRTFAYTLPDDGKWHMLSVVHTSASSSSLYVDGMFHSTINTTLNLSTYPVGAIGGHHSLNYPPGYFAHPRIYPRALTAEEIKTLYMLGTEESGTITADRVQTGTLKSLNYSAGSGDFASKGTMFNLNDGILRSESFAIKADGSAVFRGQVQGTYGVPSDVGGTPISYYGVYGASSSNYGVIGCSACCFGVFGVSEESGVMGQSLRKGVAGWATCYGVYGCSSCCYGVYGASRECGVFGVGDAYGSVGCAGVYGVYGYATSYFGVYGCTAGCHGVVGKADTNYGVVGEALTDAANKGCYGVVGCASKCYGVYGHASGCYGVYGWSVNYGVYGSVLGNYGTYGCADGCYGVYGEARICYGVVGCACYYGVAGCATLAFGVCGTAYYDGVYGQAIQCGVHGCANTFGVVGRACGDFGVVGHSCGSFGVCGLAACFGVYGYANISWPVAGNGAYYNTSTSTLKQNFEDVTVLDGLRNMCIQKWVWADANQRGFDEFIAPVAEDVTREWGLTFSDDGYYTLDGIALKAAQEIDENVQALESCVNELATCINQLSKDMQQLLAKKE